MSMTAAAAGRNEIPPCYDVFTSSPDYARRFGGATGEWFLETQRDALLSLLTRVPIGTVLDVGGGHGQIALPLAERGWKVTVCGSDPVCAELLQPALDQGKLSFAVGDPLHLPFPDGHFDVVTCFRLLAHSPQWREQIAELCRVARRLVIIDYPTLRSVNLINCVFYPIKRKLEGNTKPFSVFSDRQIRAAFKRAGGEFSGEYRQFLFPMVMHRVLRSRKISEFLERAASLTGLRRMLGSPVVYSWAPLSALIETI